MKQAISLVLLFLFSCIGISDANTKDSHALVPCQVGQRAASIGFWTWGFNARVRVYVVARDFKNEEVAQVLNVLQNWNNVSDLTGSGVKLEYQGTTGQQLECVSCLTIRRGPVFDKSMRPLTSLTAFSLRHDHVISYAVSTVEPV